MSRRPARFTEADIRRALKAAERFDVPMAVEIKPDGTIRIVPVDGKRPEEERVGENREIVL